MDAFLPRPLRPKLDPSARISRHVAISDDHREEDGLGPCVVVGHLVSHVFEGAVDVGALAQVFDVLQTPDEVLFGGELAEDHLRLGEVKASYGPRDVDLALVLLMLELLDKELCEFLDAVHQAARRTLLQGDGLRGVDGEIHLDGTVDYPGLTALGSRCGQWLEWRYSRFWTVPSARYRSGSTRWRDLRDCSLEHAQKDECWN